MRKLLLLSIVSAFTLSTLFAGSGEGPSDSKSPWIEDFEAAQELAQKEGKPMLLDFTGSDWCGWCIKLKKEVFHQEVFLDYAKDSLVLVELDFPRGKEQSEAIKAQNERLAARYSIRGFPTIILLSPEGEMLGRTGYQAGGPENYVKHLKELIGKKG